MIEELTVTQGELRTALQLPLLPEFGQREAKCRKLLVGLSVIGLRPALVDQGA